MSRGKVKIEFIENAIARKAALKRRTLAISKKAKELQTLCDVIVGFALLCINGESEVFPSNEVIGDLMAKFMLMSDVERAQKATTQEGFLSDRIARESLELQNLSEKNNMFEGEKLLGKVFEGNFNIDLIEDQRSLFCLNDFIVKKIRVIKIRNGQSRYYGENPVNINSNNDMGHLPEWHF